MSGKGWNWKRYSPRGGAGWRRFYPHHSAILLLFLESEKLMIWQVFWLIPFLVVGLPIGLWRHTVASLDNSYLCYWHRWNLQQRDCPGFSPDSLLISNILKIYLLEDIFHYILITKSNAKIQKRMIQAKIFFVCVDNWQLIIDNW